MARILQSLSFIGKIVNTSKERLCLHMPQYVKNKQYFNHVVVSTRPSNPIRNVFFRWFRYYVGQQVRFRVTVKVGEKQRGDLSKYVIVEKIPSRKSREIEFLPSVYECSIDTKNTGDISAEGDIEYRICSSGYWEEGGIIVTAKAFSPDTINERLWLIIISTLFGLAIKWLIDLLA